MIYHRKVKNKRKIKTVYFKSFIKKIIKNEDLDDIVDAKIFKKAIKISKVKNKEF